MFLLSGLISSMTLNATDCLWDFQVGWANCENGGGGFSAAIIGGGTSPGLAEAACKSSVLVDYAKCDAKQEK